MPLPPVLCCDPHPNENKHFVIYNVQTLLGVNTKQRFEREPPPGAMLSHLSQWKIPFNSVFIPVAKYLIQEAPPPLSFERDTRFRRLSLGSNFEASMDGCKMAPASPHRGSSHHLKRYVRTKDHYFQNNLLRDVVN